MLQALDIVLEPHSALNFDLELTAVFYGIHDTVCSLMVSNKPLGTSKVDGFIWRFSFTQLDSN